MNEKKRIRTLANELADFPLTLPSSRRPMEALMDDILQIGPPMIPALIKKLGERSALNPWPITNALVRMGGSVVPLLIELLGTGNDRAKKGAMNVLGELKDPRAVAPLIQVFKGEEKTEVYQSSIHALGEIGEPAVMPLISVLKARGQTAKVCAAKALCKIRDPRALRALLGAFPSSGVWLRKVLLEDLYWVKISSLEDLLLMRKLVASTLHKEGKASQEDVHSLRRIYGRWAETWGASLKEKFEGIPVPPRFRKPPKTGGRNREIGLRMVGGRIA
jgi:hypothetical protein